MQARTSGLFLNPSGHCLVSPIFEFRHFIGYNPPGLQLIVPSLCLPSSSRQFQRLAASVSHPPKSRPSCGSVVPNLIKFDQLYCKQIEQSLVGHILLSLENLPSCKREPPHCSFPIRSIYFLRFCDTAIYNDDFKNSGNQHTRLATQQSSRHIRKDAYRSVESPATFYLFFGGTRRIHSHTLALLHSGEPGDEMHVSVTPCFNQLNTRSKKVYRVGISLTLVRLLQLRSLRSLSTRSLTTGSQKDIAALLVVATLRSKSGSLSLTCTRLPL